MAQTKWIRLLGPLAGVALAILLAIPAGAQEADLSGTWTMTMLGKSPTGERDAELLFERDGFNLLVTMKSDKGEVRCVGYIDGKELRFYYIRPAGKDDFIAKFTGHVRGDLMGGEVDMGKRGITTWKATRGPEKGIDLSGTWTLQMRDGEPSSLHLLEMTFRQEGHNLVVTLKGEQTEVDCEGFIEDGIITFYYVRPTDGEQLVARFTGQLAGALMGGEVDMGGWGKTTWRATQNV